MRAFGFLGVSTVICMLFLLVTLPTKAQVTTGSMSGTVIDQSGAAIPGAQITATNRGTNAQSKTVSDSSGLFRLSLLPVGTYSIEVSKSGFATTKMSAVNVSANVDRALGQVKLQVGAASTTVEVSSAAPVIEASQAQITNTITSAQMQNFPGIEAGEGLDSMAVTLPGVNNSRDNSFSNSNGMSFAVNGLRGRSNDQQIDGQNNNDNSVTGPSLALSNPDFVQEYQATTDNFGPQYGRNSGSVINILTKSGSNAWHGDVGGQENNSVLSTLSNVQKAPQSLGFLGLTKVPRYNYEFTDATIGGPIWKNHVFVFGGFDDGIVSSNTVYSSGSDLTPTPTGIAQMTGCYGNTPSIQALGKFGPYGIGGGNPTPVGTPTGVPLSGINPATGSTFAGFAPNGTGSNAGMCVVDMAGVQRSLGDSTHEYDWVYRNDVVISDTDRFSGRYIFQKVDAFNTNAFGTAASGYPANIPDLNQSFLLDESHTFSASMINEFRASFGRENLEFGGNSIGNTIPNQGQLADAPARVSFAAPGLEAFGPTTNAPQGRIVNTYQLQDNWSFYRGRNQWTAGANFTYQRSPNSFLPDINGAYSFNDWNAFAGDVPTRITIGLGDPNLDFREYDTFLYAGDDLKLKNNLTLNLGLTWSYYGQPANLFHTITTNRQTGPTPFWNPNLPLSVTTDPVLPTVKNAFGPGIGFAYTPNWGGFFTGNGKMVIRGGYRFAYDPPYYNIYLNESTAAPMVLLQTLTGASANSNPLPADMTGPTVRASLASQLKFGVSDPRSFNRTTIAPNFGPDRVHEWSFGIQREFNPHAAIEARYVGNHGFDLFQSINSNPLVAGYAAAFPTLYNRDVSHLSSAFGVPNGTQPCPASSAVVPSATGRLNCNFGVTRERTNTGYSDYNGLQLEFRSNNLLNQLTSQISYTWSKTTDNVSEIFSTGAAGNSIAFAQDPLNFLGGEHGLSGLDFPQTFTLSLVEQIPFLRGEHGVVGHVFGGWSIGGTYTLSSAQGYTPSQIFLNAFSNGAAGDLPFDTTFIGTFETSRPFVSNPSASPMTTGIYAGDACAIFGQACSPVPANELIDFTAFNPPAEVGNLGPVTPVSKNQVHFIVNGGEADTIFGTPFGNAARNSLRDFHTNVANLSFFKDEKFGERATLRFSMTMLNALNHPNFSSVDPFIDDAGLVGLGLGFAEPQNTTGSTLANNLLTTGSGQRTIIFGLKVIF